MSTPTRRLARVAVTTEHIRYGIRRDRARNALARAIHDAFPEAEEVTTTPVVARLVMPRGELVEAVLPEKAAQFGAASAAGRLLKPVTFTLELPS